ncbi:integral membrane protein gpr180-like [Plakobranchus ocellatus]|uniref:Integral membrane protein gpr180-like n=1 Tax=Plakobranchus ocellatus TaxID=259542 RepID=A0AAV3Z4S7_9GAST|nr:integral membrane protein gpr180-like [Plakobranchus ocellatus]
MIFARQTTVVMYRQSLMYDLRHSGISLFQRTFFINYSSLLLLVINLCIFCSESKTVHGVFNSYLAQAGKGQYVTSFSFHGDAILNFTVNTTGVDAKLHLFVSEDWKDAAGDPNCYRRLAKARAIIRIDSTSRSQSVSHYMYPRIWHIVYADLYTCESGRPAVPQEVPNFIRYKIELFNPDSLGNPTEHFGDQETGLLKFYQLLTLIYFVVACVVAPQLWETLSKGGPMQLVIQLLTCSMSLQFVAVFIIIIHFYSLGHAVPIHHAIYAAQLVSWVVFSFSSFSVSLFPLALDQPEACSKSGFCPGHFTGLIVYVGAESRPELEAVPCAAQLCRDFFGGFKDPPCCHVCCQVKGIDSSRKEQAQTAIL